MTLESVHQKKIKKFLEKDDWFVIKIISASPNQLPDLVAFKKKYTMWIECKSETGKATKLQLYRHRQIKLKIDHDVIVPQGFEDFKKLYKKSSYFD